MDRVGMDAPRRLQRLLTRVPVDQLLASPSTCRNALQDTFPDDPLVASILAEAVAEGAVQRLREVDGPRGLERDGAAIRQQLSDRRGIAPENAAWAMATWAIALGLLEGDVAPRPSDRPGAAELAFLSARTLSAPRRRAGARRRRPQPAPPRSVAVTRVASAVPTDRSAPTVVRSVDAERARSARPGRRRRVLAALLITTGAVVAAIVVAAVLLTLPAPVRLALAPGTAATVHAPRGQGVGPGGAIPVGSVITARSGPAEIEVNGSAVRLDAGASVTYVEASAGTAPAAVRLTRGRAYVTASGGSPVQLETSAGSATVRDGRLVADCDADCVLQALDEPVTVHGSSAATRLTAHEAVLGASRPVVTAPDALRDDPWIHANLTRDAAEHRRLTAVAGRTVTGNWTFSLTRSDFPGAYVVHVRVSADCSTRPCRLLAHTPERGAPHVAGASGTLLASDPAGGHLTVRYAEVRATCDPLLRADGAADGRTVLEDALTLSGADSGAGETASGTRTSTYRPDGGSACSAAAFTAPTRWTVSARHRAPTSTDFPEYGAEAQTLINFVRGGASGCARGRTGSAVERWADVVCTYPASGRARPSTVEFVNYRAATTGGAGANVAAAYESLAEAAGGRPVGRCGRGPCAQALPDLGGSYFVQQRSHGTVRLVAYDTRRSDLLVIATGAITTAQMTSWFAEQHPEDRAGSGAWSWTPILRTGF